MNWKRILIGKWSWKRPFISLVSIYALLLLASCTLADRILFAPPATSYTRSHPNLDFLKTPKNESIAFVHLPAEAGMPTILYSHGNTEDLAHSSQLYEELHTRGLGVFAYDYPGYGLSTGTPNEDSCQRAIQSSWNHLTKIGISTSSIIITGRSVGSGPSVWLASNQKPSALILISPFRSAFTTAIPTPFPLFPGDRFPNHKRIKTINSPLLIIHGENDGVIPFRHGQKLFDASPATTKEFLKIPGAGHNDLFHVASKEIFTKIAEFALKETLSD
ncbi:MAG: alpha/beta hydrolase [Verrucomicrobia bacterium]|jgi:fermentation-respiration switch protein FrsA (DUF1100 family)|nr:alpha/beta hydrolase [Verrucomicrobiota bacterium]|tara:strand:- start:25094 stop:25918 length:825 start_codon:yes stop_codon:yes gene_type:complete